MKKYILVVFLLFSASLMSISLITFRPNGGRFGDDLLNVTKMMGVAWRHKIPVIMPNRPYFDKLCLSQHKIASEFYRAFKRQLIQKDSQIDPSLRDHTLFESHFNIRYEHLDKGDKESIVQAMKFDHAFVEMMRYLIAPISYEHSSYIDHSIPSIGIHVRRGSGYDDEAFIASQRMQFCPDAYFVDALQEILDLVGDQCVNVYIFTDDRNPDGIVDMLRQHINQSNINFICRSNDVQCNNVLLADFFSMVDCDYLIRSKSAFSIMAEFLGNHKMVIGPKLDPNDSLGLKKVVVPLGDEYSAAEMPSYVLITSLYNETHPERLQEYLYCLQQNLKHPLIDTIHVLYDTTKDDNDNQLLHALHDAGVTIEYIQGRPTYEYCFDRARSLYAGRTILLANADIFFNYTLFYLAGYELDNSFLALTRWDVQKNGSLLPMLFRGSPVAVSQDVWIFKSPLINFYDASMALGTQHCDGRIALQARKARCKVLNPCLSIQACHMHVSDVRHYIAEGEWTNAMAVPWSYLK